MKKSLYLGASLLAVALSSCGGQQAAIDCCGGQQAAIDYCRHQAKNKTMTYEECQKKLAESRRQSFVTDMVNRSALTNPMRH